MAKYYECKARYNKPQENGAIKRVTETYLVDALSFTEAEAKTAHELSGLDASIVAIKQSNIAEVCQPSWANQAIAATDSKIQKALAKQDGKLLKEATSADAVLDYESSGRWYLVTVNFITVNDKTGAAKKTPTRILIEADDIDAAQKLFNEHMRGTVADYEVANVAETQIVDVIRYEANNTDSETK